MSNIDEMIRKLQAVSADLTRVQEALDVPIKKRAAPAWPGGIDIPAIMQNAFSQLVPVDKALLPPDLRQQIETLLAQIETLDMEASADKTLINDLYESAQSLQMLIGANKALGSNTDPFYGDLSIPIENTMDLSPVLQQLDRLRSDPFYGDAGVPVIQ